MEPVKPTIRLWTGDGSCQAYTECKIGHELAPELTFDGTFEGKRTKIITTLPYTIEFPVEQP